MFLAVVLIPAITNAEPYNDSTFIHIVANKHQKLCDHPTQTIVKSVLRWYTARVNRTKTK
jgi:hypothetical protein